MRRLFGLVMVGVVLGSLTAGWGLRPHLPAAERGRRLAERTGCFGCHGPEGTRGTANPGSKDESVPTFADDLMMFADSSGEIREWIRDGISEKHARSQTLKEQRERSTLKMPAFKRRLSSSQIDDLVAFVSAISGSPEPDDSLAARGRTRAEALGCFGCHGPGGLLARPNSGSLKGYVPSWDEADFPELVRDRREFGEWVEHGVSRRFEHDRLAQFFLRRAVIRMPAFRRQLEPDDVDAMWAYVQWLRSETRK